MGRTSDSRAAVGTGSPPMALLRAANVSIKAPTTLDKRSFTGFLCCWLIVRGFDMRQSHDLSNARICALAFKRARIIRHNIGAGLHPQLPPDSAPSCQRQRSGQHLHHLGGPAHVSLLIGSGSRLRGKSGTQPFGFAWFVPRAFRRAIGACRVGGHGGAGEMGRGALSEFPAAACTAGAARGTAAHPRG